MTLKEQLEMLRGEPIQSKTPIEQIPCIETSDAEKLCKHPVVSVNMITYNHELYIRQAIEGVMMQQTDFEFELIIGEDASTDKTREICFEYQKKYPDKIRVLWSEENVCHLGGNSTRVQAHSRGEFLAFCEGDDYWTDSTKLQHQVEMLRKYPQAGICFSGTDYYYENLDKIAPYNTEEMLREIVPGKEVCERVVLGSAVSHNFYANARHFSGLLVRKGAWEKAKEVFYDLLHYRLRFNDTSLIACVTAISDACFYNKSGSVYRINDRGITHWGAAYLMRDSDIFGIAALVDIFKFSEVDAIDFFADKLVLHWAHVILASKPEEHKRLGRTISESPILRKLFLRPHCWVLYFFVRFGWLNKTTLKIARVFYSPYSSVRKKRNKKRYWG